MKQGFIITSKNAPQLYKDAWKALETSYSPTWEEITDAINNPRPLPKYTLEYLEAKKAKYKKYQHEYYLKVTKKKRKSKKSIQSNALNKGKLNELDNK